MRILDVKIDSLSHDEALAKIAKFLHETSPEVRPLPQAQHEVRPLMKKQHLITTPNPEIILEAQQDEGFKDILNRADLALPDGFGLILMSKFIGKPLKERITGVDFMQDICALAERMGKSVFLLGAEEGVAERAATVLQKMHPQLKIVGAEKGIECRILNAELRIDKSENQKLLEWINAARPDILFVAFGHRKQEKWIAENLPKLSSVKIAMGVGGAFDFFAGVVPRAPVLMRKMGLEWFWRLLKQPWRWQRIFRAVIVFPLKVFFSKQNQ